MNNVDELRKHINQMAAELETPVMQCTDCDTEKDARLDICTSCSGEEFEPRSAYDYLQDALDIEYICDGAREYRGARVLVAFGGPNIWINTKTSKVEGAWWSETVYAGFTDAIGLDDALRELWDCGA